MFSHLIQHSCVPIKAIWDYIEQRRGGEAWGRSYKQEKNTFKAKQTAVQLWCNEDYPKLQSEETSFANNRNFPH